MQPAFPIAVVTAEVLVAMAELAPVMRREVNGVVRDVPVPQADMRRFDGELQPGFAFAKRFGLRSQRSQCSAELSGSGGDSPAQAPVQKYQERRRNEDACERRSEVVPVARRDGEPQRAA